MPLRLCFVSRSIHSKYNIQRYWTEEAIFLLNIDCADRLVASELLPQRYDLMAASLGAYAENVTRADELDRRWIVRSQVADRPASTLRSPAPPARPSGT